MYICSNDKSKPAYLPALERWSLYKSIWKNHWEEFLRVYDMKFLSKYGELSDEKIEEVEKLLGCGDFLNGFQRYSCKDCDVNLIVPFSCKSRLCLSCYRKKLFGWSVNLSQILNIDLRHIHVTFTIPGTVSNILFQRRCEVEDMISIAADVYKKELIKFARLKFKKEDIVISDKLWLPGSIATLHKCGGSTHYVATQGSNIELGSEAAAHQPNFILYASCSFSGNNSYYPQRDKGSIESFFYALQEICV